MHIHLLSAPPAFLAVLPDHPGFGGSVVYQIIGLLVVFTALGLIWLALTLVGLWFKRSAAATAKAPAAVSAAPAPVPVGAGEIPPEVVAVIAAAVQSTLAGSYRIEAIVPATHAQDWAHEGRRRIFASHHVR